MVIPSKSPLILGIFEQFHSSPIGGHEVVLKIYKRMATEVYWRGMKKEVEESIASCLVYQENNN